MAVTVKVRNLALDGVPNAGQIAAKIAILKDPTESYNDRKMAAGWLRGAWMVTKRNPKFKKAAEYMNAVLSEHRYPEDTQQD